MPSEKLVGRDYGAKDGMLASHRWLGANTMVPKYYGFDDQMAKVIAFLQNSVFSVDIFAVELGSRPAMKALPVPQGCTTGTLLNEKLIAPLGLTRFDLNPGALLTVSVVVQNKGIAHSHVPEQRDMYESWIDFTVKDGVYPTFLTPGAIYTLFAGLS
jgi:hypothetical protein